VHEVVSTAMDSFYSSISPFCTFARFMGFFPFEIRDEELKITLYSLSITTISIGYLLAETISNVFYQYSAYVENAEKFLDTFVWAWFLWFVLPVIWLQFFIQMMFKQKEVKTLFQLMLKIDSKFNNLYLNIDHSRHRKVVKFIVIATLGVMTARQCSSILIYYHLPFFEKSMLFQEIGYAHYLLYECFFCLQFIVPTYLLRERFQILKSLLR
jgi:hypothetical protein